MSIQKKGNKFYSVISYTDGEKHKLKWTPLESKSIEEAQVEEELIRAQKALGIPNKNELKKVKFSKLIEYQSQEYQIRIKDSTITEYTVEMYQLWIKKYISPFFADLPAFAINNIKIREFEKFLLNQNLSIKTIRKIFVPLREIIDRGVDLGVITINYARNIKFKKPPLTEVQKRIEVNCMELKEFIEFCDWIEDIDVDFFFAAMFAGRVGLRRSELAGLKFGDINFKKHTLQLHSGRLPKGYVSNLKNVYSAQMVALPDIIMAYLYAYRCEKRSPDEYVFFDRKKNKPYSVYWFSYQAKKYTKQFFAEKYNKDRFITIHGFRHTFASYIVNSGYSIKSAQAMLRHGDVNSTQIYLHPEADSTKKITRELDDYITAKWENEWMPEDRRREMQELEKNDDLTKIIARI